jgi:hypothetical protein
MNRPGTRKLNRKWFTIVVEVGVLAEKEVIPEVR